MRRSTLRAAASPLALVLVFACGGEPAEEQVQPGDEPAPVETPAPAAPSGTEVATEYAPELNVDLGAMERRGSGLMVQQLAEGEGEAAEAGDQVFVHYTGWLPDGSQFDSSRDRGTPIDFTLGAGQVIDGWDEGIAGLRPGGQRRLVIPPALAYGAEGMPPVIPASATLVFDVELVRIGN